MKALANPTGKRQALGIPKHERNMAQAILRKVVLIPIHKRSYVDNCCKLGEVGRVA